MNRSLATLLLTAAGMFSVAAAPPGQPERTRTIHLVQDDAQEYMVSKVYDLMYL